MSELSKKLKETLNKEQFEAAVLVDGPAVIMAGAGSGKTHTLMNRVANLVDSGYVAERILMLTFTNAAADEMKSRASRLLDKRCGNIVACTYHKFCNMMLRRYGKIIHIEDYSILSYPETKNMIEYVKSSNPMFDNLKGFPTASIVADIMSIIVNKQTTLKSVLTRFEKYEKYRDYETEIEILIDSVQVYGFRNKKFTYDDLLVYMNELLSNDDVCRRIAGSYQFIMVDEFQDTNNLQESIILKLSQYNKNIVVVGDISQSIYGFRGSNVRNLQNFNTNFENCKTVVLNNNYRSSQEILDAANSVMRSNVKSWQYYDMFAVNKNGSKPTMVKCMDSHAESNYIMEMIDYFHNKGVPYSEIAVLERGSMSSFALENMLTQKGIKFNKMGGMKFMDYDCVGDMLAYFGVIVNPHDLLSWFRVLQLHPYVGNTFAKKVADGCNSLDFLTNNAFTNRKFYSELVLLKDKYDYFRQHDDLMSLFDAVADFYFDLRVRSVEASRMKDENKEEERMNIERDRSVVDVLKQMASKYNSVVEFVDDIMLDSVSNNDDESDDVLTISTIHSAKGLEWSVVFIMDCIEGVFPAKITPDKYGTEEDEEELRCFYVALTRAKDELFVITPKYRMSYSGMEQATMSHYLMRSQNYFESFEYKK